MNKNSKIYVVSSIITLLLNILIPYTILYNTKTLILYLYWLILTIIWIIYTILYLNMEIKTITE
ncbi:MAG: hypothetical protein QXU89_01875 [Desulfurococcaceae archaeon]